MLRIVEWQIHGFLLKVGQDQNTLVTQNTFIGNDIVNVNKFWDRLAVDKHVLVLVVAGPQFYEASIVMVDGVFVVDRVVDVDDPVIRVDRQPRPSSGRRETRVFRVAVPLHGGTRVVPAPVGYQPKDVSGVHPGRDSGVVLTVGVDVLVPIDRGELDVFHANLLALVDDRSAPEPEQDGGQKFLGDSRNVFLPATEVLVDGTVLVVVLEVRRAPATPPLDAGLHVEEGVPQFVDRPVGRAVPLSGLGDVDVGGPEVERHVEKPVGSDKVFELIVRHGSFGQGHDVLMFRERVVLQPAKKVLDARLVDDVFVDRNQTVVTVGLDDTFNHGLFDVHDGVDSETGNALFDPPVDHAVEFLSHFGIFPVEVGHLLAESVEVEHVWFVWNGFPRRSSKVRPPIVRWSPIDPSLEKVVASVLAVGVPKSLLEPFMLIGRVIDDKIQKDSDTFTLGRRDEVVKVIVRSILFRDCVIIRDVISVIRTRGLVHRADPYQVGTKALDIIQSGRDPIKVSYSIAVGVLETARIDLVDDGFFPPFSPL